MTQLKTQTLAWQEAELKILQTYKKPSKSLIQITDELRVKGYPRTKKAVEDAIGRYDIHKDITLETAAYYDIEATNLSSDFGYMLCFRVKQEDEHDQFWPKVKCKCPPKFIGWTVNRADILGQKWDLEGCKKFLQVAKDFDRVIGYYSKKFDSEFLKTRCLYWAAKGKISREQIDAITWGHIRHTDVWRIAHDNINPHSRRLESLVKFFHLGEKTALDPEVWISAQSGNKAALNYIADHCEKDVTTLEIIHDALAPFAPHSRASF